MSDGYDELMGTVQPAHLGSQSESPEKQADEARKQAARVTLSSVVRSPEARSNWVSKYSNKDF